MLCIDRTKQHDRIIVTHGGETLIIVVDRRVRLGLEGPRSFTILRSELADAAPETEGERS